MAILFNTPAGSPTNSFDTNLFSAVRGFNILPTAAPESGTAPIQHSTPTGSPTISFNKNLNSPIRAYS